MVVDSYDDLSYTTFLILACTGVKPLVQFSNSALECPTIVAAIQDLKPNFHAYLPSRRCLRSAATRRRDGFDGLVKALRNTSLSAPRSTMRS